MLYNLRRKSAEKIVLARTNKMESAPPNMYYFICSLQQFYEVGIISVLQMRKQFQ